MNSDHHHHYDQLFQEPHQQNQMNSGLTRFRSAPSSFFANLLDRDFYEEFLNRPSSPETERILVGLMSSGGVEGDGRSPRNAESAGDVLPVLTAGMKSEAQEFVQQQPPGQSYYQRQSSPLQQQQPAMLNRDSGFGGASQAGLNQFGQVKSGGGGNRNGNASNLIRHSSSPAGLFADVAIDENGFVPMEGMRDFGSRLSNNQLNVSSKPPPSSSSMGHHMSPIAEHKAFGRDNRDNDFAAAYRVAPWDDAVRMSENYSIFERNSEFKASEALHEEGRSRPPTGLVHHLSLPKTSAEMSSIEKLLQMQDSVPCKIRAKRGCATHPRSIAERVRRTKISERMRKLQDLVPNMDKQTNTADMLDLAVDYVKELQEQVKTLSSDRARCTCSNGQQQQPNQI